MIVTRSVFGLLWVILILYFSGEVFLYCPIMEWVDFLGVLVVSPAKFEKRSKSFYYYNL